MLVFRRLDLLGRNLRHLINFIEELTALGIAFVSVGEGIDATTPAGKLQLHVPARSFVGLASRAPGSAFAPVFGFSTDASTCRRRVRRFCFARFMPVFER